ncbi:MAG: hypothetical protein QUV08_06940 [Parasphingorhabdus sp.]|nr:hypothetical protein [Parasphingorhabdus sp.]
MKQANRQQAVNRRRQLLSRAAVGQRLLNRGRRQIDRRGPFKACDSFSFCPLASPTPTSTGALGSAKAIVNSLKINSSSID